MDNDDILFGPIRPAGTDVSSEEKKADARARYQAKKALKRASGAVITEQPVLTQANKGGRPKSIVNRVTEYGALFNKLNEERIAAGLPPLKTAMEVLIDAMQSDEIDIKDKAKIADKLAPFESSRAPIISIEHVQNIAKDEEVSADDALDDFLAAIRKV
jgi:hypothetical protein